MLLDDRNVTHQLADEARAALAEPEISSKSPTDEELRQLRRNHEWPIVDSLLFVIARAVLARWGRPAPQLAACPACEGQPALRNTPCAVCGTDRPAPQPPADGEERNLIRGARLPAAGEVAELVADMRNQANHGYCEFISRDDLRSAADLLERLSPPQPVPVAERLPGPGDCDAEGLCWVWNFTVGTEPLWRLTDPSMRSRYHSHWLPANALPTPCND